jgi:hypothetical protein
VVGAARDDPTNDIVTAWIAKEELRTLPATAKRGGVRSMPRPPGCTGSMPGAPAPPRLSLRASSSHQRHRVVAKMPRELRSVAAAWVPALGS